MACRQALISLLALLAVWTVAQPAVAQSCSVTPATGSFGSIDVLPGTAIDSTSTFSVSCSGAANNTVRLCIEMGRGVSAAGPSGERALTSGSNYLDFDFYSDSARTQLWGSWGRVIIAYGTAGVSYDLALGSTGSASHTFTAYARIAAGQTTAAPATYTWNGLSPGLAYGYATATACPTGGATTTSGGSNWDATIAAGCNISTSTMNFGSTSSFISSNIDSAATITAQCTNTSAYSIGLSNGVNASGSQNRMRLGATSNYVTYGLYTDAARSNAWATTTSATGCTSGTSTCALGTGTGSSQSVTVYGRVPPQNVPAAGSFTDTVVVTVTF
jgi:spore coat protein U-like protein